VSFISVLGGDLAPLDYRDETPTRRRRRRRNKGGGKRDLRIAALILQAAPELRFSEDRLGARRVDWASCGE
jgi:hypothetical protein